MLGRWVDGRINLYLQRHASSKLIAALEHSTFAPNLNAAPGIANDDPSSYPRRPMRQVLYSARLNEGDPFNAPRQQLSDPVCINAGLLVYQSA